MDAKELFKQYLREARVMQIATVAGDQPWICTVYFVAAETQRLYWLSLPSRRHSKEIAVHNKAAIAVAVKFDKPVIGVQAEGIVREVSDSNVIAKIMKLYVRKYDQGETFYENFVAGKNQHALYEFTPKNVVLFDEVNFSGELTRQEWRPSED